ncbi:MAG: hypothetical protein ACI9N0_003460 [Ilumatobacter sp.]|jgi:hypothetical protein
MCHELRCIFRRIEQHVERAADVPPERDNFATNLVTLGGDAP